MQSSFLFLFAVLFGTAVSHGEGAEGTIMGPVAFLWPDDRPWSSSADNIAPCGSSAAITNRTIFPLSQGSVALTIADEAFNVAFYIAYDNNPISTSDFQQQAVKNIGEVEPGHQCYKLAAIPSDIKHGSNATIQLEYWAKESDENNGQQQMYYACADITFVEAVDFNVQVPCFNVTVADFNTSSTATSTASTSATATADNGVASTSSAAVSSSDSMSAGTKAGIAVGAILGSFVVVGVLAYVLLRKRKGPGNAASDEFHAKRPTSPPMASA